jgi:hypothetical protein
MNAGEVVISRGEEYRIVKVTDGGDVMGRPLSVEDAGGDAGHTLQRLGSVDEFVSYETVADVTPEHLGPVAVAADVTRFRLALLGEWPDVDGDLAWIDRDVAKQLANSVLGWF